MPGNGPAPSENRRRTNADVYADVKTVLVDDDEIRGPALTGEWSAFTRAWWDNWRRSPQAAAFLITDWQRLRMVASLVEAYMLRPSPQALAEIRQNESLLGATHVDRLKARMKVDKEKPPQAGAPAGVTALQDYRTRLSG